MNNQSTDLELALWKDKSRKIAAENFEKIIESHRNPGERASHLNALITNVANVNDPALTKLYAKGLSKRKIMKQKDFTQRVKACVLEPVNNQEQEQKINPNILADQILKERSIVYLNDNFYVYKDGVFERISDKQVDGIIKKYAANKFSTYLSKETKAALAADALKNPDQVNQSVGFLNLKNGMLDLNTFQLLPHNPSYLSTVQLPCLFDTNAKCPKWLQFLEEVLGDDPLKVNILQEFFGYCLTPLTNQERVILMVGDGANGKSKVLDVIQGVFGLKNVSAVPLEQFKNPHYLAKFFGSMVNISYETNAKTEVYESTFKQL